ncbi:hypothetical protein [Krasilnikovia sp. MM14-A1259]|uniref:hypothetical protein n=1 Tax=Krasilnikovia sp. MM14-A1259 TaxID=3373539 RepID=UPI003802BACE
MGEGDECGVMFHDRILPQRSDTTAPNDDGTGPPLTVAQRWSGYAMPLYDGEAATPTAIGIWGYSGD